MSVKLSVIVLTLQIVALLYVKLLRTYLANSYGKYTTKNTLSQESFQNCSILSCGLSEGVHPYGVIKRYHDYVIFDL